MSLSETLLRQCGIACCLPSETVMVWDNETGNGFFPDARSPKEVRQHPFLTDIEILT